MPAGRPIQVYTLPLKLDRMLFAGTTVVFFSIINALKLVPYLMLGQFSRENLSLSASLMPVAIAGVLLGVWLVRRVSQRIFYMVTYVTMLVVGRQAGLGRPGDHAPEAVPNCRKPFVPSVGGLHSQLLKAVLDGEFLTLDLSDFGVIRAWMCKHLFKLEVELLVPLLKLPDVRIKGHFISSIALS